MAEVNNSGVLNGNTVRPTGWDDPDAEDTQLHKLRRYDSSLGRAGHANMHAVPASFFVWSMYVLTVANNNTKASAKVKAPYPLTIWGADVACETAAGTTGTVNLLVDNASILDAAQDVKTTAGTAVRVAPEDGSEEVDFDQTIHITQTSGSAADMVGGQAHLFCQRL